MARTSGKIAGRGQTLYLDGRTQSGRGAGVGAIFWKENYASRKVYLIFGAMRDKGRGRSDRHAFFPPWPTKVVFFTQPGTPRAVSARQLAEKWAGDHAAKIHRDRGRGAGSWQFALFEGRARRTPSSSPGSLYLVGELRPMCGNARRKSRVALEKTVEWGLPFQGCFAGRRGPAFCFVGAQNFQGRVSNA